MAVTQIIKLDLNNHKADDIIIRVGESYTRKIVFIPGTYDGDDFTPVEFYGREDGPRALFRLVKPDRTFVMQNLTVVLEEPDTGFYSFELVPDEYMSQVAGIGYYDIRINDSDTEEEFLYTVQGRVLIDDDMITDSMIESVAAVNGLVFPDDFLTSADLSNYATKQYVDDAIAAIPDTLDIYSTSEHIVGTWIDGKSVFEKTFYIQNPSYNIASGTRISDSEFEYIDQVVSIEGTFKRISGSNIMAYKFDGGETTGLSGDPYGWTRVDISDTGNHGILYFIRVYNESAKDAIITVRYTKAD